MGWKRGTCKGKDVWIEVDAGGQPLVQGGRVPVRYSDKAGSKTYRAGVRNVELTGAVQGDPTGNPLRGLVVLPSRDRLPPDGLSSAMINIIATDEYGYPVADVPLTLTLGAGDGELAGPDRGAGAVAEERVAYCEVVHAGCLPVHESAHYSTRW